jgi:hypothetical protein
MIKPRASATLASLARLAALGAAAFAALAVVPSAGALAQGTLRSFLVEQQAPVLSPVDLPPAGPSAGDMLAFEAAIRTEDGAAGTLRGNLVTVDLPDDGDPFEDRLGHLVFDLGGGDGIVVAGGSVYAKDTQEMPAGRPQVRAVIGGSGAFIGARGHVTTTRDADGTYAHRFELLE